MILVADDKLHIGRLNRVFSDHFHFTLTDFPNFRVVTAVAMETAT